MSADNIPSAHDVPPEKRKQRLQINPDPLRRVKYRIGEVPPESLVKQEKRELEEASRRRARKRR